MNLNSKDSILHVSSDNEFNSVSESALDEFVPMNFIVIRGSFKLQINKAWAKVIMKRSRFKFIVYRTGRQQDSFKKEVSNTDSKMI